MSNTNAYVIDRGLKFKEYEQCQVCRIWHYKGRKHTCDKPGNNLNKMKVKTLSDADRERIKKSAAEKSDALYRGKS